MTRERVFIAGTAFATLFLVFWLDWHFDSFFGSLLAIAVLGALALTELYVMLRRIGLDSNPAFGVGAAVVLFLWRGLGEVLGLPSEVMWESVLGLLAVVVIWPFLTAMFRGEAQASSGRGEFERVAVTLLGLLLVWFLLSFLLELRLLDAGGEEGHEGFKLTLILVLTVKLADSAAYVVGRSMGKTPLTWVSPRKTWEGSAASVGAAVGISLLLGVPFGFKAWQMALFGAVTNVAGQIGDLLESFIKRRAGVKDSGTFLREIGGFLDLLDSLLLAAPVAYLFARLVVL